jgi:hypothetical protein
MQGYSPKLPLIHDATEDGLYGLNKTILDSVKQNFKMLLLTNPGERIMDSDFGVGIRRFLFEQNVEETRQQLQARIVAQTRKYLNFIKITEINISSPDSNNENLVYVNIRYTVPALNINDELNINP